MLKRSFKMTLVIVTLGVSAALLFVFFAPQLGAAGQGRRMAASSHYRGGRFFNPVPTTVSTPTGSRLDSPGEALNGQEQQEPRTLLPSVAVEVNSLGAGEGLRVTWLGHSTALIELDGKVILTDPMFSDRASPFAFFGPKRFAVETPLHLEDLPRVDAVLISHDHYDHLDYRSIQKLTRKTSRFCVPLGVGGHLERWGVPRDRIVELDWWEEASCDELTFAATPARHFSGRWLTRDTTLWASWVIRGKELKVFFSGDSGYFDGFKQIGEKYGPFDITLLESGAYNESWSQIHMMPEETIQAHLDLRGKVLLPIHWGQFNLSVHAWTEPIERLIAAAKRKSVAVATPMMGQAVTSNGNLPKADWWRLQTVDSLDHGGQASRATQSF